MSESLDGEGGKLLRFTRFVRRSLAIALVTSQVAVLAAGISALASRPVQAAGANPLYTGPVNGADTTYGGAILTGSYDGAVSVTNDNDFTAIAIPTGTIELVNLSTIPGSPQGNVFSLASPITIQVPHSFYYDDTNNPKNHVITFVAQAPTGWTTEICADSYTTRAGTLVITDDGTQNTTSQQTISNWAAFSKGLYAALSAGLSTNTACGMTPASPCGDTTAGTTFAYAGGQPSGVGATKFIATVGGSAFQLYPSGFAGETSQGSITFAVQVQ